MPFNSPSYILFLAATLLLFWSIPSRLRWALLLVASFAFYGFLGQPLLIVALAAVTLFSFFMGRCIDAAQLPARRRSLLWIGVWGNLSLVIGLKYLPFLADNLNFLLRTTLHGTGVPTPPLLVSIGISFYAFQAISYLADIYFRMARPEPHLGYFALYLSFFPKLLLGPIERAGDLLPQFRKQYALDLAALRSGLLLFGWGLFKKIAVADRLAQWVDPVYANVHAFGGVPLLLAAYAYALQLYCDFSGYTDMARGTARLFGIELTPNFDAPFLARSVAEFWRRWHITFSRWILDYIFEPLQMRFRNWGKWGSAGALLITFVLAGVWHGASWTFVVFGAIHGIYLACSVLYKPYRKKINRALGVTDSKLLAAWQTVLTFNLVCIPWVYFRAASVSDAGYLLGHLFSGTRGLDSLLAAAGGYRELALVALTVGVMATVYLVRRHLVSDSDFSARPLWFRLAAYYGLIVLLALCRVTSGPQFIYLNF